MDKTTKTAPSKASGRTACSAAGDGMKNYLSFGGGVNSVALYLLMEQLGMEFEAIFVDHGGDWPETYEYVDYFIATGRPVTILKPLVNTKENIKFDSIIDYMMFRRITPSRQSKLCTDRFKIVTIYNYVDTPCFMHIGYAAEEAGRASINSEKGVENRYLLIENNIDRNDCKRIIVDTGIDIPMKSGCYICPYQGRSQFMQLRRKHPDLFCKAKTIEEQQNNRVKKDGTPWKKYYLCGVPLEKIDKQLPLPGFKLDYPPCHCG